MHSQGGFVAQHDREVERERLHVRALFRHDIESQHVNRRPGIRFVEHVGCGVQDDGPGQVRARNEPQGVLARFDRVARDEEVVIERDARRGIGARMPDAVPGDELAEQLAPARHGPAVLDGDPRERDVLTHAAALTEWVSLSEGRRSPRKEDQADKFLHASRHHRSSERASFYWQNLR